jgi:hypothetical protein
LLQAFGANGLGWPNVGKLLLVVGEDNENKMRLRMFNADGKKDDWREGKFCKSPKALAALKQDYRAMHARNLTASERGRVALNVSLIHGVGPDFDVLIDRVRSAGVLLNPGYVGQYLKQIPGYTNVKGKDISSTAAKLESKGGLPTRR